MALSRYEQIKDNFIVVTKRLPLKARLTLTICVIIVVVELVSSLVEISSIQEQQQATSKYGIKSVIKDVGKIRERKELHEDNLLFNALYESQLVINKMNRNVKPVGSDDSIIESVVKKDTATLFHNSIPQNNRTSNATRVENIKIKKKLIELADLKKKKKYIKFYSMDRNL